MKTNLIIKIYSSVVDIPESWNNLAVNNIFLTKDYLETLEKSAPSNIICHFIGFFCQDELVGIAVSQFLDLNQLASFGERDKCVKTAIRNVFFKRLCSKILIIGNNMLTGQNAFSFSDKIQKVDFFQALKIAVEKLTVLLKNDGLQVHITTFKDFQEEDVKAVNKASFKNHFQFSAQPNMVFSIPNHWQSEQDYIDALSKKYRDQYKRARKKAVGIEKRRMEFEDIVKYQETIYDLYYHVAKNAHFNTFFLTKNHFSVVKEILQEKLLFYGYFVDNKLIGFNTLIKNGNTMNTYFLGYNEAIQKEKMLYLNMLYDMIAYSINQGYNEIVFARTALEIKSSVGAKPQQLNSFANHSNKFANLAFEKVYSYLEPKAEWIHRNPFK